MTHVHEYTIDDMKYEDDALYVSAIDTDLLYYKMNSCTATVVEGELNGKKWATIYNIQSAEQGKGHATKLLSALKKHYKGWDFGGTVALNGTMKHLYKKLDIKEYE